MNNEKFYIIWESQINGNFAQFKAQLKKLSRAERIEFIEYLESQIVCYDDIITVCKLIINNFKRC